MTILRLEIQTSRYLLDSGDPYECAGEADCSDISGKNHLDTTVPMIQNRKVSGQLKTVILYFIYLLSTFFISIMPQPG